jgi:hypothetical protein
MMLAQLLFVHCSAQLSGFKAAAEGLKQLLMAKAASWFSFAIAANTINKQPILCLLQQRCRCCCGRCCNSWWSCCRCRQCCAVHSAAADVTAAADQDGSICWADVLFCLFCLLPCAGACSNHCHCC